MNVLSLFDGMSCGQIALNRLGIKVDNYFACEIDKYAIKVTQKNFPNTVQLGSVTDLHSLDILLPKIDLVIGGSPCQGFSFAGKQLNFEDPRSKLFFEFVRILEEVKVENPDVKFLLENVKMKKEYRDVISKHLGCEPIEINSALVSAQNRKRLYWTNIEGVTQPEDKGILLRDIVHEQVDCLSKIEPFNVNPSGKGMNGSAYHVGRGKSNTLTTNKGEGQKIAIDVAEYIVPFDETLQILEKEVQSGKMGYFRKDSQANRVYFTHNKAVTLTGDSGGGAAKMGQYFFGSVVLRVPEATKKGYVDINPNEGVDLTFINSKTRRGRRMEDKANCLTASAHKLSLFSCVASDGDLSKRKFFTLTAEDGCGVLIEGYIRKLTPIECERLQTVPLDYTSGVNSTQRYKMLGNGWTVDVINHIFKNL